MKVLIVIGCARIEDAPFVLLQKNNLEELGVEISIFSIYKKGISGYIKLIPLYLRKVKEFNPDIIHAHYSVAGLFAFSQFRKPVIISYIGSDVIEKKIRLIAWFTMMFAKYSIFISKSLINTVPFKKDNFRMIPYGIDLVNFYSIDKRIARIKLGLDQNQIYCLFPSLKTRREKNFVFAERCISEIEGVNIIELGKNLPIEEINLIFNACDFMLLTSLHEGGPQVIFEALATNLPIVSTDVGVVKESIEGVDGCYLCSYELCDAVNKINKAILFNRKTEGRRKLKKLNLDSRLLNQELFELYKTIKN